MSDSVRTRFLSTPAEDALAELELAVNDFVAIDAQTIIGTILQGYGHRVSTFQSPLSFGNDSSLKPYAYDPAQAKQWLAEAGVKPAGWWRA